MRSAFVGFNVELSVDSGPLLALQNDEAVYHDTVRRAVSSLLTNAQICRLSTGDC